MQSTLPKAVYKLAQQVVDANRTAGRTIVTQSFIAGLGVQDGNGHGTHLAMLT